MKQTEIANKLNKHQSFVSKYESGERRLDLIELHAICQCMNYPLTKLIQSFEENI